ncbi:MAG: hypothetical protein SV765_08940 [Pseudomonadota bacterium]|nr:hypothetical protein [Pseudomonadota bacterium]
MWHRIITGWVLCLTIVGLIQGCATDAPGDSVGSSITGWQHYEYTLVLDGFTPAEVAGIEESLLDMQGYASHRPMYLSERRSEILYHSSIRAPDLRRELKSILTTMELSHIIRLDGEQLLVRKVARRRSMQLPPENEAYQW